MTALRILMLGWVFTLLGCGPTEPKCIPVSGKVTLDGGAVPGPGFIYFNPDPDQTGLMRPGTAEFDAQGNYKAKTFTPDDGLLPGKYKLRVDCWKTPPNMEGKTVVSYLPGKYQDAAKSELEFTVDASKKSLTFNIDLKSK
jgi:hypothetical protein